MPAKKTNRTVNNRLANRNRTVSGRRKTDRSDMDMTIIEQAKGLADKVLPNPPPNMISPWWSVRLGRYPRKHHGRRRSPLRMRPAFGCGHPAVASRRCPVPDDLLSGQGPKRSKAISHIEAEGKMKEYNDMLAEKTRTLRAGYERAHETVPRVPP